VVIPVPLPRFSVASTKRGKDAGSTRGGATGATEDAASRRVIASEKHGGWHREGHSHELELRNVAQREPVRHACDELDDLLRLLPTICHVLEDAPYGCPGAFLL
jgi:hypothetical protein